MKVLNTTGQFETAGQRDFSTMRQWSKYAHRTPAEKVKFMSDQFVSIRVEHVKTADNKTQVMYSYD